MSEAADRDLIWHRSSVCADSACVEVARDDDHVYVRDGGATKPGVLRFTRAEWTAFATGLKRGDFDSI